MALTQRQHTLRQRGGDELAPLWIEALEPEAALAELFGRRGNLFLLQKARFLRELGRREDAEEVLAELTDLPPGLAELRDELSGALAGGEEELPDQEPPEMASATLAALHASQGDPEAAIDMYRAVLARDPNDAQARDGLRNLVGPEQRGSSEALGAWLQRVRQWRTEHGV